MSAKELRRNGRMGEEIMRITFVGAVLIVAAVILVVLAVRKLNEKRNPEPEGNLGPTGSARQ